MVATGARHGEAPSCLDRAARTLVYRIRLAVRDATHPRQELGAGPLTRVAYPVTGLGSTHGVVTDAAVPTAKPACASGVDMKNPVR